MVLALLGQLVKRFQIPLIQILEIKIIQNIMLSRITWQVLVPAGHRLYFRKVIQYGIPADLFHAEILHNADR